MDFSIFLHHLSDLFLFTAYNVYCCYFCSSRLNDHYLSIHFSSRSGPSIKRKRLTILFNLNQDALKLKYQHLHSISFDIYNEPTQILLEQTARVPTQPQKHSVWTNNLLNVNGRLGWQLSHTVRGFQCGLRADVSEHTSKYN